MTTASDNGPRTRWTEINAKLGDLPFTEGRHSYDIPDSIPNTAAEILVYAHVSTGDANPRSEQHYRIWVEPRNGQSSAFLLLVNAYDQPAWSYNSDNVWLPLPSDRHLFAELDEGKTIGGNRRGGLRIIGYR